MTSTQKLSLTTVAVGLIALMVGVTWQARWEESHDERALARAFERLDYIKARLHLPAHLRDDGIMPDYARPSGFFPYLIEHPVALAFLVAGLTLVVGRVLIFMGRLEAASATSGDNSATFTSLSGTADH